MPRTCLKKSYFLFHYISFVSLLVLTACISSDDLPVNGVEKFDFRSGIPIISDSIKIDNLLEGFKSDAELRLNRDGTYSFLFGPQKFSLPKAEDFIKIPSQSINIDYSIPVFLSGNFPTIGSALPISIPFQISEGNGLLSSSALSALYFKQGSIKINVAQSGLSNVNLKFSFPELIHKRNGSTFEINLSNIGSTVSNTSYSIADYKLVSNGNTTAINCNISGSIGSVNSLGAFINLSRISIENIKWSALVGKIGAFDFPVFDGGNNKETQIDIDPLKMAEQNTSGTQLEKIKFGNPTLNISFKNNYGISDFKIALSPLAGYKEDGTLLSSITQPPIRLERPGQTVGVDANGTNISIAFAETDFAMKTKAINELLELAPSKINYGIRLQSDGLSSSATDYIQDNSIIEGESTLELPTELLISDLDFSQESVFSQENRDLKFSNITAGGLGISLEKFQMRYYYENNFPLEFKFQIYFLDEDKKVIGELFSLPQSINAAKVDSKGEITQPAKPRGNKPVAVSLEPKKLERIFKNCYYTRSVITIATPDAEDGKYVLITKDNALYLRLSGFVEGEADF